MKKNRDYEKLSVEIEKLRKEVEELKSLMRDIVQIMFDEDDEIDDDARPFHNN